MERTDESILHINIMEKSRIAKWEYIEEGMGNRLLSRQREKRIDSVNNCQKSRYGCWT